MIVYAIKLINTKRINLESSYYKGKNSTCEFTNIISYAKLFQAESSALTKLDVLNYYYKDCDFIKFKVVKVEIKEL